MTIILLIVLSVLIFVTLAVIIILTAASKKTMYRSDVHFSGGADIETGRISKDDNFFKGVTGQDLNTVYKRYPRNGDLKHKFKITVVNAKDSTSNVFSVLDSLTIGRTGNSDSLNLYSDHMVSKQHCRLIVNSGRVFLEDLNSSNHTYLNGKLVTAVTECKSGDLLKVGSTQLYIYF